MAKVNQPLVVVVGETASGKSALGLEIAKRFNGEIICADSRTVYKGMDIGTAKPSTAELKQVPHHLLDIVEPDEDFNVAMFQKLANQAISDISNRDKLSVMVGGTGLYVDSVIFSYNLDKGTKSELREDTLVIGLKLPRALLRERIELRVEAMFRRGLRKEVDRLVSQYGWDIDAMTGIGYREFNTQKTGVKSVSRIKRDIVKNTLEFAKRQRTWFKRNRDIQWFENPDEALKTVATWLKSV